MSSSIVREFVSNIKASDGFAGQKKIVAQSRFRPSRDSKQGDVFTTHKSRDPSVLWIMGLVSPSDRELMIVNGGVNLG